ncbi:MAG: hypothetical protein GF350_03265 [Chitinivibrionales bacterium]|nr:hypothetical protein [Chitinivibrionales bacterium]
MPRRVCITGIGIIAPNGETKDEFWSNCLAGNAGVSPIPGQWYSYSDFVSTLWTRLPEIHWEKYPVSRIERMQQGKATLMLCAASHQALADAGLQNRLVDPRKGVYCIDAVDPLRTGVFIGTGIGGISTFIENQAYHTFTPIRAVLDTTDEAAGNIPGQSSSSTRRESLDKLMVMPFRFNPFAVSITMPNACSAIPGIKYGLKGPNRTFPGACAAGTIAIGNAFRAIQSGASDCALTGGVEYLFDPFGGLFKGFDLAKALVTDCSDPETANRPFDSDRSGFLFSEGGAAVLVLEEESHAKNRGAGIIAEITGFAESFDAHNIMIMEPSGKEIERMLVAALADAPVSARDIDYINAHATGTRVNDQTEAAVIERMFGKKPLVNSTKSLIGHTLGASGAIEAAVTALSIRNSTTHVCKNLENPVRDLNFVTESRSYDITCALSQSFAFGGHNAALVMRRYGD